MSLLQSVADFKLLATLQGIARSLEKINEVLDKKFGDGQEVKGEKYVLMSLDKNEFIADKCGTEIIAYTSDLRLALTFSLEEACSLRKNAKEPLAMLVWK